VTTGKVLGGQRIVALLRQLVRPRKVNPSRVVVRQLRPDDIVRFFPPKELSLAEKWLARQVRGEIYIAVAEVDGVPVGRRCLDLERYRAAGAVYGFAASVLPQWRSRGIGAVIDAHCQAVALAKGFRAIRCSGDKTNLRARSWHERLGYRIVGDRIEHWVEGDGREVTADCWDFERRFDPANAKADVR
jgi:ribosomal protein S18 acetylase RimI-like enzyme